MNRLQELLSDHLGRTYTAASAEVRAGGEVVFRAAHGCADPDGGCIRSGRPVSVSTLFDLASLTKLFATTAFFRLMESGKVGLGEPVGAILPAFRGPRKILPYPDPLESGRWISAVPPTEEIVDAGEVTFKHLLTHSSGLPAWLNLREKSSKAERIEMCLSTPFAYPTGSQAVYSDIGFILLGEAIERIAGMRLDRAIEALVAEPLGLGVRYGRTIADVASTGLCAWRRRRLVGEVHDDNAAALGGIAGHAGLFGTAGDVARLGQLYLDGGAGLISGACVENAVATHIGDRGLGWMKPSPEGSSSGDHFSPDSYGHTGFTGTSLWVDPQQGLVCALLTNRVYFGRDAAAIGGFRRKFHDTVVEVLKGSGAGRLGNNLREASFPI